MKRFLPLLLTPSAALAHAGDHATTGLLHMLTEPDHLAILGALAVAAILVAHKFRARR